jgi:DHA1 family multidrug resistance protein-like MFS transporter
MACPISQWLLTNTSYRSSEPVIAVMMIYMALLYALLYGFFVSIPYAFQDLRGFSLQGLGLVYLSLVVGFSFGALTLASFQHQVNKRAFDRETLLVQALGGALLVPAGLFLFAWTAPFVEVHFIVPCIGIALFCWGCCTIFTSVS